MMMYSNWHWVKKFLLVQLYIYKNPQEDLKMNEWMFMCPMTQRTPVVMLLQLTEMEQGGPIFKQT